MPIQYTVPGFEPTNSKSYRGPILEDNLLFNLGYTIKIAWKQTT